jgi:hypothetical protein
MFSSDERVRGAYLHDSYERAFIQRRYDMFANSATFWGRNRSDLIKLEKIADFPKGAYHTINDDPVVTYPDFLPIMLLKRKYLNTLRQRLMKLHRQGKHVGAYASQKYGDSEKNRVLAHINKHRQQHGLEPIKKVWW